MPLRNRPKGAVPVISFRRRRTRIRKRPSGGHPHRHHQTSIETSIAGAKIHLRRRRRRRRVASHHHHPLLLLLLLELLHFNPLLDRRLVRRQLRSSPREIDLELAELALEQGDDADAAVDRVSQPHLGLVGEGVHGVLSLERFQVVEDLRHVARPEDPVDVDEFLWLVRRKIRGEDTLGLAFSPEKLAAGARGADRLPAGRCRGWRGRRLPVVH